MRTIFFFSIFILLALAPISHAQVIPKISRISERHLIKMFSAKDRKKAESASREIFRRGEQMIPVLFSLESSDSCFYGLTALGQWKGGTVRLNPSCDGPFKVTLSVAALYLVNAIYREDVEFATPPLLCKFSAEQKVCLDSGNTRESVASAWSYARTWRVLLESQGMTTLRDRNAGPLENSPLRFY